MHNSKYEIEVNIPCSECGEFGLGTLKTLLDKTFNGLPITLISVGELNKCTCENESNRVQPEVMPENLRAMERLTAKQALEIDDLKIRLNDANEKIKDVIQTITCIGAPLNDNIDHFNKQQLKIFFKIEQILSA